MQLRRDGAGLCKEGKSSMLGIVLQQVSSIQYLMGRPKAGGFFHLLDKLASIVQQLFGDAATQDAGSSQAPLLV